MSVERKREGAPITKTISKTQSSFYRRLYVAYLIDRGVSTVPAIMNATGMPRRTAQDTISALKDIGVQCEFVGATKNGEYRINDWGPIKQSWVENNLKHVEDVLQFWRPGD